MLFQKGGQTRGYLNINDTLQCVELAVQNPCACGELRIINQFTETFSVNTIAAHVQKAGKKFGMDVQIENLPNPRKEKEEHYYNPKHSSLLGLGLKPIYLNEEVMGNMIKKVHTRGMSSVASVPAMVPRVGLCLGFGINAGS